MSNNHRNKIWTALVVVMAIGFGLLLAYLVQGKNIALFNPQGIVAKEQHELMIFTVGLLLVFAVPTVAVLFYTAWKYRESSPSTQKNSKNINSKLLVPVMWVAPSVFILVLISVMWPATHRLAPTKALDSTTKAMTIQVISLRWKWLFIYPEQRIATVNYVQLPVGTPVQFELTADEAPMSSFWIPNLGGQLYAMTSHTNRLNLMAETPGEYPGSTPEINGAGFSGMKFKTIASSNQDFDQWVSEVKSTGSVLNEEAYNQLLVPSKDNPVTYYSAYQDNLYNKVVEKYAELNGEHGNHQ